jgi:hypothetical protein
MVKKKSYLDLKRARGEGYMQYPSPDREWGFTPLLKRYFIDTTDSRFNQGDFSIREREGVSVASSGAMSSVWALQALGSRVCFGLFRWLLAGFMVKAISLSEVSRNSSFKTFRLSSEISEFD